MSEIVDIKLKELWPPSYSGDREFRVSEGAPRKALEGILRDGQEYTLVKTVANSAASEELFKYVGSRTGMSSDWDIRLITPDVERQVEHVPGAANRHNGLWFAPGLLNTYMRALGEMVREDLGENSYATFPLVQTINVHSLDHRSSSIYLPVIHVVAGDSSKFRELVAGLNGDRAYEKLRGFESPQFYKMGEIDTLRKLGIDPVVAGAEWKTDAANLANAVNFLVQCTVQYINHGNTIRVD